MPRIERNGEGEPVWLTPHLRDPQPEGERERERENLKPCQKSVMYSFVLKDTLINSMSHVLIVVKLVQIVCLNKEV